MEKMTEMRERNSQMTRKQEMETRISEGGCDAVVTTSPLGLSNATEAAAL
jgi:uroporphyrinogen-III synthase